MRDGTRGKNLIVQHPDKPDRSSRFRREAGPRGGKRILWGVGWVASESPKTLTGTRVCHGKNVLEPTIARPRAVARRVASPLLSFRSLFETACYAGLPNAAIVGSIGRARKRPRRASLHGTMIIDRRSRSARPMWMQEPRRKRCRLPDHSSCDRSRSRAVGR
jgi:hypothetical protein